MTVVSLAQSVRPRSRLPENFQPLMFRVSRAVQPVNMLEIFEPQLLGVSPDRSADVAEVQPANILSLALLLEMPTFGCTWISLIAGRYASQGHAEALL